MIYEDILPNPTFNNITGGTSSNDVVTVLPNGDINIDNNNGVGLNIYNNGGLSIGSVSSPNQIQFNGAIGFQYNAIRNHNGLLLLDASYYFIEIFDVRTNPIQLPKCSTTNGRAYIISNNRESTPLIINTFYGDNIDTNNSITLEIKSQRISILSNGVDEWIIN